MKTSLRKQSLDVIGDQRKELVMLGESDKKTRFVHDVVRSVLIDDIPPTDVGQPASNSTKNGIPSTSIPLLGSYARIHIGIDHTLQHLQDLVATPTGTNHLATQSQSTVHIINRETFSVYYIQLIYICRWFDPMKIYLNEKFP